MQLNVLIGYMKGKLAECCVSVQPPHASQSEQIYY